MKSSYYLAMTHTDKKSLYPSFYDLAIASLLSFTNSIRVLEIGCTAILNRRGTGSSNAFSKMPFVEEYIGIDVTPPAHDFGKKATFIRGNAYNKEFVDELKSLNKKFHLIIDDGNHEVDSQIKFFQLYEQFLEEKSIMVCEDVYMPPGEEKYKNPILYSLNDADIFVVSHPWIQKKLLSKGYKEAKDDYNLLVKIKF